MHSVRNVNLRLLAILEFTSYYYWIILYLPMIGSSFALPSAALTMPMIARIKNTILQMLMIVAIKPSLHEIA